MKLKRLFDRKKNHRRKPRPNAFVLESLEPRLLLSATPMTAAVVTTDHVDYAPGETAVITTSNTNGDGLQFGAGEFVRFEVTRTDGMADAAGTTADVGPAGNEAWYVTDGLGGFTAHQQIGVDRDANGVADWIAPDNDLTVNSSISTTWFVEEQYRNSSLLVTAAGQESGAVASQAFTDAAENTTTTVTSSGGPSVVFPGAFESTYGDAVTFTATVTAAVGANGSPTGTVEFYNGATLLGTATTGTPDSVTHSTSFSLTIDTLSASNFLQGIYAQISAKYISNNIGDTGWNDSTSGTIQQIVNQRQINGFITVADKVYDGTNTATELTRGLNPGDVLARDVGNVILTNGPGTFPVGGPAAFQQAKADFNTAVFLMHAILTGTAGSNYHLQNANIGTTANIFQKEITGGFLAANKVYDGTTAATVLTRTLTGVLGTDDVQLSGGIATFDTANVGTGKTVTLTGATLIGTAASNYRLASVNTTTADITALGITAITGNFTVANKVYDGTTAATVLTRTLTGVLGTDDVQLSGGIATFDTANVGTGKTVTLTGATLIGTAASNYTLTSVNTTTADITALGITAITGNFTVANKVYDGTTAATVLTRTLTGVLGTDDVQLSGGIATFDTANVGTGKTVTLTGATLTGTAASNYTLTSVNTTTADITALGITAITGNFTVANKVYDGTTAATVLTRTLTGVLGTDDVQLSGGIATFDTANVGTGKTVTLTGATLTGTAASNYTLTSVNTTTADITALGITAITGNFTVANKVYDGTTAATVLTRTLTGVLGTDDVQLSGGIATFDTANVGTGKTVTLTGATLTGTAASNYTLTSVNTTTADITALGITGNFTAANKVYDGTRAASVLTRTLAGVLAADVGNVSLTGGTATFSNANVRVNKTVTLTGATLTGAAASNYSLASVNTTTANITALGITGNFTAANKVYDGTTVASVLTRTLAGVLAGDVGNVSLTGGTATFSNANVGTGKTVTLTGATLGGTAARNYSLLSVATTTADIAKANATFHLTGYYGTYDGAAHQATGTATGVLGEDLSAGLNLSVPTHTNAGVYIDTVTFTDGTGNYKNTIKNVKSTINKANAVITLTSYVGTYDGAAHQATGTATGVLGEDLSAGLNLSVTPHSNAGVYIDTVTFTDVTGNYKNTIKNVKSTIYQANAVITVTGYSVTFDGLAHTATGTATGVLGEDLSAGLDLSSTTHTNVGTYLNVVTFTDVTGNYKFTVKNVSSRIL